MDLLPRQAGERLQALAAKLGQAATFERVFNVSAARGAGMAELRADLLARRAPTLSLHPTLYPTCWPGAQWRGVGPGAADLTRSQHASPGMSGAALCCALRLRPRRRESCAAALVLRLVCLLARRLGSARVPQAHHRSRV